MSFQKAAVPTGCAFPDRALARFAEAIVQRIAGTAHRADRINTVTTIERFAQTADVHVDSTFIDINVAAPYSVEQLFARKHPARALHQEFQQAEFGRPEVHGAA